MCADGRITHGQVSEKTGSVIPFSLPFLQAGTKRQKVRQRAPALGSAVAGLVKIVKWIQYDEGGEVMGRPGTWQ